MKQYQATVRASGIWIKTIVFAQFGSANVLGTPTAVS